MEGFPSGQREQTVNLSSMTSVVRIHHLPPKQKDIPKGMSFFCFGGRWLWIRKVALRNHPVDGFNHRGFHRSESESTTGRVGRRVAVRLWDCTSQSRQAEALFEGTKGRHAPDPKGRTGCPTMKSTCTCHCRGAPVCAPCQPSARIHSAVWRGKGGHIGPPLRKWCRYGESVQTVYTAE